MKLKREARSNTFSSLPESPHAAGELVLRRTFPLISRFQCLVILSGFLGGGGSYHSGRDFDEMLYLLVVG